MSSLLTTVVILYIHFLLMWLYTMSSLSSPVATLCLYFFLLFILDYNCYTPCFSSFYCGFSLCSCDYTMYPLLTPVAILCPHFLLCGYTMPLVLTPVATLCLYFFLLFILDYNCYTPCFSSFYCGFSLCSCDYIMYPLLTPVAILCPHFLLLWLHYAFSSFSCGYTMPLVLSHVATLCLYFFLLCLYLWIHFGILWFNTVSSLITTVPIHYVFILPTVAIHYVLNTYNCIFTINESMNCRCICIARHSTIACSTLFAVHITFLKFLNLPWKIVFRSFYSRYIDGFSNKYHFRYHLLIR